MANNTALVGSQQPQQQQAVNKPAAGKQGNVLPLWGNEKTMNLNPMILTNVLSSPYFKVQLYELKTYHEAVDEIYFKVTHVEPWEKGSRKTAGQTGMCGGVRGVGTGGIVSTAFCLLYKLFTLKLTRKQVMGLITHTDSPYIRALGFMYIRYTQPPSDLLDWFDGFLDDEEELDVKAGGGCVMTIGEMLRSFLTKLEWFSTLFPRIPVPVQKTIDQQMKSRPRKVLKKDGKEEMETERYMEHRRSRSPRRTPTPRRSPKRSRSKSHHRDGHGSSSFDWQLERERERQRKEREGMDRDRAERDRAAKDRRHSHSPERVSGLHGGRGRDHRRSRSASRDKKNERLEREGDGNRSRRKGRDHEKGRATERDRERSRDRRAKGEAEDRRRREERDDKRHKDKRRAKKLSGIREGRHRSRNRGTKRSRSKDGTTRQRPECPSSRRSRSRGRADGEDRARKREQSRSKERVYQREHSNGKEQPSKHEHARSHGVDLGNGAPRSRPESS